MKVTFRPSIDEHVTFIASRQRAQQSKTSNAVTWFLFTFNLGFVPAILVFKNLLGWAAFVFALNAIVLIFLLSWQQKRGLREYYKQTSPDLEDHDCTIEISQTGITCEHNDNRTSYPWKNVREIKTTEELVVFDLGHAPILISKRGFASDLELDSFVSLGNRLKANSSET